MKAEKDNYNYGLDILKIIATFMIIAMHILGQGGVIRGSEVGSINYYIVWTIESICYVGVNLYALGTGYLNVKKKVKMSSLIKRWLQVFFYCIFFTALFEIFMPEVVSLKSWIKACVPILSNQYWYFTQYFVLFMAMPFLNKMMNALDKEEYKKLIVAILLVLSIIPMVRQYDIFLTGHGFSAIWLMALYIIGGYFSLYKSNGKYSKKVLWGSIIIANIVAVGSKFLVDGINHVEVNDMLSLALIDYTSFPIVISSIAMFILAMNMDITKGQRIIKTVGKATFGIYLFHVNPLIWSYVLRDLFMFLGTQNVLIMLAGVVGFNLVIFIISMIFELLRIKFFEMARINKLGDWFGSKVDNLEEKLIKKIF